MSPLWVSYRSMTSWFPPFAFVELVSPYNKKNITRWLEDMNSMFSWQEQYLTRSLRSLVRYCSCHSNIKFISSRHRVISSIYTGLRVVPPLLSLSCVMHSVQGAVRYTKFFFRGFLSRHARWTKQKRDYSQSNCIHALDICHWIQLPLANYKPSESIHS